jgi:hypothetical protein
MDWLVRDEARCDAKCTGHETRGFRGGVATQRQTPTSSILLLVHPISISISSTSTSTSTSIRATPTFAAFSVFQSTPPFTRKQAVHRETLSRPCRLHGVLLQYAILSVGPSTQRISFAIYALLIRASWERYSRKAQAV